MKVIQEETFAVSCGCVCKVQFRENKKHYFSLDPSNCSKKNANVLDIWNEISVLTGMKADGSSGELHDQ